MILCFWLLWLLGLLVVQQIELPATEFNVSSPSRAASRRVPHYGWWSGFV